MGILKYMQQLICRYKGHSLTILEVRQFNDVIRCSRCNKLRGVKYG